MAKRVAVLAVNPVNGMGLFSYLETFYENGIPYKLFAVAETPQIRTNSGIRLEADGVIAQLKGHEEEFDAIVFSCGDAVPVFAQHATEPHNVDLMEVLRAFDRAGKLMIGHCAAGLMFELAGIAEGCRITLHPMVKGAISKAIATDELCQTDGRFYTAQEEHALPELLPRLVEALK